MILTAQHARLILAGRKTQVRVPVSEPRLVTRKNGTSYNSRPFIPTAGLRIPIRTKHGDEPVCQIIVRDARHQLLADLAFPDALAEGHRTTIEFKAWWVRQHDAHWVLRHEAPDDEPPEPLSDDELVARFDRRHATRPVWAIEFILDRDQQLRYLADAGHGDERGYTSTATAALRGELPAVEDRWLKQFADEGEQANQRRRGEIEDAMLSERRDLAQRLLNTRALARERGVDVSSDLRVIERRIEAMDRKIREQHTRRAA